MTLRGRSTGLPSRWLRDLSRAAQWNRRLLTAGLLAGSVAFALHALAPPPPETVAVLAAAGDLSAGQQLGIEDIAVVHRTPDTIPAGALRSVSAARGATVLSGVRSGELLTDVRLLSRAGVNHLGDGLVAAPVRIADAEAVRLLRPGAHVDVLAAGAPEISGAGDTSASARLVASAARVLAVPPAGDGFGAGLADGALVLLATTEATAARLAGAAVTDRLSVVLLGR
jgi:Flp pilus assembly protein CpaB